MLRTPVDPDISDIPEAIAAPKGRWSVSMVWLIPIVAVVIGGWLAVKAVLERGPVITITFKTAEGLEAGKTKIKYKNVDIGEVKHVALSEDHSRIVVTAELAKQAEGFLVEDTRFWVVRPRIAGGQVSGLGTLFSGSYIGVDIGTSGNAQSEFVGVEVPPIVTGDQPGRQFVLRGPELGSLDIGSPIYFRREAVGRVLAHELDQDGAGVTVRVFVEAPYHKFVTQNTRFWQASGIDVVADSTGVKVHTESVVSILLGGIAFETPADGTVVQPTDDQHVFSLFPDRVQAMKRADLDVVPMVIYFSESLRGLSVGASVDFSGVPIGEVKSIGAEMDPVTAAIRMPVRIALYPDRLRALSSETITNPTPEERKARFDALVGAGFRAQLRTGSLLTGQLYVALDFFPNAPKAQIDWTKKPPVLPAVPGGLQELQASLGGLARKLQQVPFEQISADVHHTMQQLQQTLQSADKFVKRLDADITPAARTALEEARRALGAAERTLNGEAPLQQDARGALRELSRAAQSMRALADSLERHPEALLRGKKEHKP